MTTITEPQSQPAIVPTDNDVEHIVGDTQRILSRLGLKAPRALCGLPLETGESITSEPNGQPTCPECLVRAGRRA